MRPACVPALSLTVPLEGHVVVRLVCASAEDEVALRRHLTRRDLVFELGLAIDELLVALADLGDEEQAA